MKLSWTIYPPTEGRLPRLGLLCSHPTVTVTELEAVIAQLMVLREDMQAGRTGSGSMGIVEPAGPDYNRA